MSHSFLLPLLPLLRRFQLNTMKSNPRAPYVIRSIVVGSEPMFDYVLPAQELANQIIDIRSQLKSVAPATQVTLSDMPWAYSQQTPSDRKAVIDAGEWCVKSSVE